MSQSTIQFQFCKRTEKFVIWSGLSDFVCVCVDLFKRQILLHTWLVLSQTLKDFVSINNPLLTKKSSSNLFLRIQFRILFLLLLIVWLAATVCVCAHNLIRPILEERVSFKLWTDKQTILLNNNELRVCVNMQVRK